MIRADRSRVSKGVRYLRRNWHRPIQVVDLSRAANLSRRGFYKAFQKSFGVTPGAQLRRLRIQRAKALMAAGKLDLESIARRCGYRSANSLYVAFRRFAGLTPAAYRVSLKQRDCALRRDPVHED